MNGHPATTSRRPRKGVVRTIIDSIRRALSDPWVIGPVAAIYAVAAGFYFGAQPLARAVVLWAVPELGQ